MRSAGTPFLRNPTKSVRFDDTSLQYFTSSPTEMASSKSDDKSTDTSEKSDKYTSGDRKPATSGTSGMFSSYAAPGASTVNDSSLTPSPFSGLPKENCREWLNYYKRYVIFKQLPEQAAIALFALLMRGAANVWFTSLSDDERADLGHVMETFETKFSPAPITKWKRASDFWSRDQRPQESVEEYYADMLKRVKDVGMEEETAMTRYAIMRGLRPALRTYVMQQNPTSLDELVTAAKVTEATVTETTPAVNSEILEAISRLEQRVTNSIPDNRRSASNRSPTPTRRDNYRRYDNRGPTKGGFSQAPAQRGAPQARAWGPPTTQPPRFTSYQTAPPQQLPQATAPPFGQQPPNQPGCTHCARLHMPGNCVARGKLCRNCGKMNHFAICCRSQRRTE